MLVCPDAHRHVITTDLITARMGLCSLLTLWYQHLPNPRTSSREHTCSSSEKKTFTATDRNSGIHTSKRSQFYTCPAICMPHVWATSQTNDYRIRSSAQNSATSSTDCGSRVWCRWLRWWARLGWPTCLGDLCVLLPCCPDEVKLASN